MFKIYKFIWTHVRIFLTSSLSLTKIITNGLKIITIQTTFGIKMQIAHLFRIFKIKKNILIKAKHNRVSKRPFNYLTTQSFFKLETQIKHVAVMLAKEDKILISQSIHDLINETGIIVANEHALCVILPNSGSDFPC